MSKFYRKLITGTPSYSIPGIYSVKEHRYIQSTAFGLLGGLVPITYLVVGGGGMGGLGGVGGPDGSISGTGLANPGAGGGAGGVVTNDYTNPFLLKATSGTSQLLIITVGAGGAMPVRAPSNLSALIGGEDSSITGGNLYIVGLGGGGGGKSSYAGATDHGGSGGSGGGMAPRPDFQSAADYPGTGLQSTSTWGGFGNNGGLGPNGGANGIGTMGGAGGGGGAGAPGGDADIGTFGNGGDGGNGYITSIITTSQATTLSVGEVVGNQVYFAGGGGGGEVYLPALTAVVTGSGGQGGLGGGAGGGQFVGSFAGTFNGRLAFPNSGGGGVGTAVRTSVGAQLVGTPGGSGVVIIKYPDYYPAAAEGSGATVLVENGYRIYTWKTSGTFRLDL